MKIKLSCILFLVSQPGCHNNLAGLHAHNQYSPKSYFSPDSLFFLLSGRLVAEQGKGHCVGKKKRRKFHSGFDPGRVDLNRTYVTVNDRRTRGNLKLFQPHSQSTQGQHSFFPQDNPTVEGYLKTWGQPRTLKSLKTRKRSAMKIDKDPIFYLSWLVLYHAQAMAVIICSIWYFLIVTIHTIQVGEKGEQIWIVTTFVEDTFPVHDQNSELRLTLFHIAHWCTCIADFICTETTLITQHPQHMIKYIP